MSDAKFSIAFDFDGVLFDSEKANFLATKTALQKLGLELSKQEFIDYWTVKTKTPQGEKALENFAREKGVAVDRALYRKTKDPIKEKIYLEKLRPLPAAQQALEFFRSRGFPMGIVSLNNTHFIGIALKKFGFEKFFEFIIAADELQNQKPHPEPYLRALEKFGSKPWQTIAIEDNPIGIESAKAAGLKCIAIPNDFTQQCDFSRADLVLNDLAEIEDETIEGLR